MAKHILGGGDEELDFLLIGINSTEDMYHLIARVNDCLGIDLYLSDHAPFHRKDGRIFQFALFRYDDGRMGHGYTFVPNLSNFEVRETKGEAPDGLFASEEIDERMRLVKELPQTDFFIMVRGEDMHLQQFHILERLKTVGEIRQVQIIEPNDLPSKRNLIF